MDTLLIAKILGVYMIASGLFMVFRGKTLAVVMKDLFDHRAIMWLAGLLLILLGGFLAFGAVVATWITWLGWLIIIKGALYIIAPEFFMRFPLKKSGPILPLLGLIAILLGLFLYMGL